MKYIYTITTVYHSTDSDCSSNRKSDNRCVGWYSTLTDAYRSIENDDGLFNEAGYWPYMVIEKMREGIYPIGILRLWFEYNDESRCWLPIVDPPFSYGVVNYGIG